MADYTSAARVKTSLQITDTTNDLEISLAIQAASQMIENECGTRFWIPAAAETRYYTAVNHQLVVFDDIASTVAGAAPTITITIDLDGDGTPEQAMAASDYVLMPRNAALNGEPYTSARIHVDGDYTFPLIQDGVKVVAQFGYADTIPASIEKACVIQAVRLFKRRDAPFGVSGTNNFGQLQIIPALDPDLKLLIAPFKRLGVP